jgi:hypothetical protein
MASTLDVYTAPAVARQVDKSEGWGRLAFKSGMIPTEVMINGKQPAVTAATLTKIVAKLKAIRCGRPR